MTQNKNYNEAMINVQEALNLYDYAILALISDTSKKPLVIIEKADSLYSLFINISEILDLPEDEELIINELKNGFIHFRHDWISSLITAPSIKYYMSSKEKEFRALRNSLNYLMMNFQVKIINDSETLYENYKRALTPSIITLITSLILILIFNVIFGRLYINPLLKITEAVSKYHYKRSFNVEIETKDEIADLAKSIDEMTKLIKK